MKRAIKRISIGQSVMRTGIDNGVIEGVGRQKGGGNRQTTKTRCPAQGHWATANRLPSCPAHLMSCSSKFLESEDVTKGMDNAYHDFSRRSGVIVVCATVATSDDEQAKGIIALGGNRQQALVLVSLTPFKLTILPPHLTTRDNTTTRDTTTQHNTTRDDNTRRDETTINRREHVPTDMV